MTCKCEETLHNTMAQAESFDAYKDACEAWNHYQHEGCDCPEDSEESFFGMMRGMIEAVQEAYRVATVDPEYAYDLALADARLEKKRQCEEAWGDYEDACCAF
jgi:hypothetical protein